MRTIVPRTLSVVSLTWKALRKPCRRAALLARGQECQTETKERAAISTQSDVQSICELPSPFTGSINLQAGDKWSEECR